MRCIRPRLVSGERTARPCRTARGWFDRDHVRAKVRKDHPRDHALVVGQVDDPVVLQSVRSPSRGSFAAYLAKVVRILRG